MYRPSLPHRACMTLSERYLFPFLAHPSARWKIYKRFTCQVIAQTKAITSRLSLAWSRMLWWPVTHVPSCHGYHVTWCTPSSKIIIIIFFQIPIFFFKFQTYLCIEHQIGGKNRFFTFLNLISYIYIYIQRDKEREREAAERQRQRQKYKPDEGEQMIWGICKKSYY